jgi:hypothetical protein
VPIVAASLACLIGLRRPRVVKETT